MAPSSIKKQKKPKWSEMTYEERINVLLSQIKSHRRKIAFLEVEFNKLKDKFPRHTHDEGGGAVITEKLYPNNGQDYHVVSLVDGIEDNMLDYIDFEEEEGEISG